MESDNNIFDDEINSLLNQIKTAESPDEDLWRKIWDTVHHQGDIFDVSFVVVPKIFKIYSEKHWLDYNLPGLFATIENCRQKEGNPKLPESLENEYFQTLDKTVQYCAENISANWDRNLLTAFLLLVCAIKKNQGIYEILEIVSASEYDEEFLLEFYNKS